MRKIALGIGGLALAGAPLLAQSLPVAAPVADGEELGGGGETVIIAALIAGIAGIAVLAAADDDTPASP
ncbi:MAG: hypothetical protein AAGL10_11495 [Pseudomonadota bacterium]